MGHYRSEMVDTESETAKRRQLRSDIEAGIRERVMSDGRISPDGLVSFLADILGDQSVSGVQNRCRDRGRTLRESTRS